MATDNIKLRDRLTAGGHVNLADRSGGDDVPPGDVYSLSISITPSRISPNEQAIVALHAKKNGLDVGAGLWAEVYTTDPDVTDVPDEVSLGIDGRGSFGLIGKVAGEATITASFVMDGITTFSPPAILDVYQQTPTQNLLMTGWGKLVFGLELPTAIALVPRTERLTHQEQLRKYGGTDLGLEYASQMENIQIVFLPKVLQE